MTRRSDQAPVTWRRPPSTCPGFSLAETAVLTACIMLVLLASVPAVERLHKAWTLRAGTCLMESTLQWGRLHAISANVSLILEVDAEGKSTGWRDPETGNTYDTGVCHLPADVRIVSAPWLRMPWKTRKPRRLVSCRSEPGRPNPGGETLTVHPCTRARIPRKHLDCGGGYAPATSTG